MLLLTLFVLPTVMFVLALAAQGEFVSCPPDALTCCWADLPCTSGRKLGEVVAELVENHEASLEIAVIAPWQAWAPLIAAETTRRRADMVGRGAAITGGRG